MPWNSPRPNLRKHHFKPDEDEPYSPKQLQVRLPVWLREELDEIPSKKRNQLVREWITRGFNEYRQQAINKNAPPLSATTLKED